jgi:hypothetical protein
VRELDFRFFLNGTKIGAPFHGEAGWWSHTCCCVCCCCSCWCHAVLWGHRVCCA